MASASAQAHRYSEEVHRATIGAAWPVFVTTCPGHRRNVVLAPLAQVLLRDVRHEPRALGIDSTAKPGQLLIGLSRRLKSLSVRTTALGRMWV